MSCAATKGMQMVNMHQAKTHLSRLVAGAAQGQSFIIAKGGKPLVKVVPLDKYDAPTRQRLGFMRGEIEVPDDFDEMAAAEISTLFSAEDHGPAA